MSTFIIATAYDYEGLDLSEPIQSYATREEAEAAVPKRKRGGVSYEVFEVLPPVVQPCNCVGGCL